jgi:hypothetical protein
MNIHGASHIALDLLQRNKDLRCRQKKLTSVRGFNKLILSCCLYYRNFVPLFKFSIFMDLNHIQLSPLLLTDFYKTHLVESPAIHPLSPVAPENTNTKKGIQYLGKNQKGICLLVTYAKDVYLPDDQLNFLTSILQACRLNLGDVAIVNHYREKVSFDELRKQLGCNYLLVFGVECAAIGLKEIPLFGIQNINDCNIVYSPAAEELNNNNPESKMLKSKLWICLKQLFNV